MTRIALIIPTLDRSGAEKQLSLLAVGLAERGWTPHVFTLDRTGPYADDLRATGIDVSCVNKRGKADYSAVRRLRAEIRTFDPEVVHTWLFAGHAYGWLATRSLQVPWIQSLRCVDSWKAGWQNWIDRRLWPKVSRFVANGESVRDWYVEQGVPREQITVVRNGVALNETNSSRSVRSELGIPEDARVVLIVGRLAHQKRVRDLLWAFQLTRQANEDAWLIVVGDGPESAELREYARSVEAAKQAFFVGHVDDPRPYFETADVYWLGSDFEGQSNSLQEAMSYGLSIVASDIGPNRELITHGVQGYLPNVGDSAGFAQFTTKLLREPEDADRVGAAARDRIEQEFSISSMVDAYIDEYECLISDTSRPASI